MKKLLKQLSSWAAKKLSTLVIACNDTQSHNRGVMTTMRLRNKSAMTEKVAFTLAEVLITLAIIGVVAALTIPTLISKYNTMVLNNQFKKAYATISQALNYAQSEYGRIPLCYYGENGLANQTSECKELAEKMLNILKVSKKCESNALANGCIPEYKGIDELLKEQHKNDADYDEDYWQNRAGNCPGYMINNIKTRNAAFVLSDGTIILAYSPTSSFSCLMAIDINGKKGPNKWGHDLHAFRIYSDGNHFKYKGAPACMVPQDGGVMTNIKMKQLFGHE